MALGGAGSGFRDLGFGVEAFIPSTSTGRC